MPAQGDALLYTFPPVRGDGGPHAVEDGVAPSSFGMDATTLGPTYGAAQIFASERRANFAFRSSFWKARNHDWKTHDINGMQIPSGTRSVTQPFLSQAGGAAPSYFVPMTQRRPNNPYRIGRKIVGAFTGLLFSHGRWPQILSDDPDTQDAAAAISEACDLETTMIRARNTGGSCGLVGVSWGWVDGLPRVRVHEGEYLHCLRWSEQDDQLPEHVTELYKFQRLVTNAKTKKQELVDFWHRRDWTPVADIVFRDCMVEDEEPNWEALIDHDRSFIHNHRRIHFEWIANLPADDVEAADDGQPDYAETYESQNTLDITNSVVVQGSIRNLDPTLVLQVDEERVANGVVSKGSDNALIVGKPGEGDAKYLELSGGTITAGLTLVDKEAQQILDTCDCILTDPDKLAAQGTSAVALKMIYASMIAKADIMRTQYGRPIRNILDGLVDDWRRYLPDSPDQQVMVPVYRDTGEGEELMDDTEPEEEPVVFTANLPKRQVKTPALDDQGQPTGEENVEEVDRVPGTGVVRIQWGEYFKPTADDVQKSTQAISQAAGGKSVISQKTAVQLAANLYEVDATEEWVAISAENADARRHDLEQASGMYPRGGEGEPLVHPSENDTSEEDELTVDEAIDQLTVNEVRAALKRPLGPLKLQDGSLNPDGFLPVAEYKAKLAAKGTVDGETEAGAPPVEAPPKQPQGNVPGEPGLTQKPFGGGVGVTPAPTASAPPPKVPAPPKPPPPQDTDK